MSDLVEFLTARLDEDYEVAYGAAPSPWRQGRWDGYPNGPREVLDRHGGMTARAYYGGTFGHVLRFDPTRMLRDIEAKRAVVGLWREQPNVFAEVIAHLAEAYSDHVDYEPEWLP